MRNHPGGFWATVSRLMVSVTLALSVLLVVSLAASIWLQPALMRIDVLAKILGASALAERIAVASLVFISGVLIYVMWLNRRMRHALSERGKELAGRERAEWELKSHAVALELANRALEQTNDAAKTATRAKSEFLANMSHEIRTPMTAILGFTEVLLENVSDPESVEAAETIKRNGDHLLEIINDILDLSKIEAGKLKVERIPFSPCQTIADIASLMRVRADAKGLPLTMEYAGPIPETITTDPTRLRQILINLVGNAIKFTETGGIRVVTRLVDEEDRKPMLQFDVVDTGIGMKQEQVDVLFNAFSQADTSTSRKFGGTGLGLVISKRLAGRLGGDITVASEPGKGSTFSVTVAAGPLDGVRILARPEEAIVENKQAVKAVSKPKTTLNCRILLAEDGPDNQRLISFVLKKAGAEVKIAVNGKEALEKALATYPGWGKRHGDETEPFDIILMDMQMPVMDGYEATRRLREEGYTGPIVALSAHAMSHAVEKSLEAGCDDFAPKPIDREALLALIARYVQKETGSPVPTR
jgi:signal transduction histidine kinase/AmiR/NasT family two-component response regulator